MALTKIKTGSVSDSITLTTPTIDGVLTANAGVVVDNFTLDGTTLALSSGDMLVDVAGNITLDADDAGEIRLKDGGTQYGALKIDSSRFKIQSIISDADMLFAGNDNGSEITALTLDMSAAGAATFNSKVGVGVSPTARLDIAGMAAGEVGLQITSPRNDALTNGLAYINVTDSVAPFAALKINHAGTGPAIVALGDVGIGTSSPRSVTNYSVVGINGTSGSAIDFELGEALKTTLTQTASQFEINVVPALPMVFKTSNSTRMTIDSAGNIKSQYGTSNGYSQSSGYGGMNYQNDNGSTGGALILTTNADRGWSNMYVNRFDWSAGDDERVMQIAVNGSAVGYIKSTSSGTSFLTSSDYRLKENVVPMIGSIDRVKALKPSRFNFIADADTTVDGFLAHEVEAVVPEAISGTKDAMRDEEYEVTAAVEEVRDEDNNITTEAAEAVMGTRNVQDLQSIDQSKLVPLLVAALQEAIARIEILEGA
jgi:hypothetical protein